MKKNLILCLLIVNTQFVFASKGHFEDNLADIISWLVMIVLPIAGIYLFWKAHIYPEKVAEKNHHPQLEAIKTMCLLSLFVGGLLWPFALIWASYKYPEKDFQEDENSYLDTINTEEPLIVKKTTNENSEISSEEPIKP